MYYYENSNNNFEGEKQSTTQKRTISNPYDNLEDNKEENIFLDKLQKLNEFSIELNDVIKIQNTKLKMLKNPLMHAYNQLKKNTLSLHYIGKTTFRSFYSYFIAFMIILVLFFIFYILF